MTPLALAILLGAFLVFQVQPILGRYVIPWFGGGASTWTTCILFFQVMLLGGYAYAHALTRRLTPRRQAQVHLVILGLSLLFLPLRPSAPADAVTAGAPVVGILWLLLVQVGLPYLVLSATGPLLQSWFAVTCPGRSPYRLYALSNAGSLLALLSYPFCFEPTMTLGSQGWLWSGSYVLFAVCVTFTAVALYRAPELDTHNALVAPTHREECAGSSSKKVVFWVLLAAAGSLLLMATTSLICQDMTAMPLLWVLPLALYLATFILCFEHERWYRRWLWFPCLSGTLVAVVLVLNETLSLPMWWQIGLFSAVLLSGCMVCHGELSRARPVATDLTRFYLAVAAGGALGGVFSVLVAPLLFPDYWEYHLALLMVVVLAIVGGHRRQQACPMPRWVTASGGCAAVVLAVTLVGQIVDKQSCDVEAVRNFYGVLHVQRRTDEFGRPVARVIHGRTTHGTQLVDDHRSHWPTAYYGRESGVGIALAALEGPAGPRPRRVGVIGLGAGTVAALVEARDVVRFYEINPDVERLARQHFTYLADSAADIDVVIGDGRLALAQEAARGERQEFDLLAVDAFNSDAVPMHLLTLEALAVYEHHLTPDTGVLAFHVSNRYVDLLPVLRGLAAAGGFDLRVIVSPGEAERAGTLDAVWVLMSRDRGFMAHPVVCHAAEPYSAEANTLWTDEFGSLLPLLKAEAPMSGRWHATPLRGGFVIDAAGLLDRTDEDRLLRKLRMLHHDTGGAGTLVVATVQQPAPGTTPKQYAATLFGRLDLRERARDHGVLILLSVRDRHAVLHLGSAWDATQRAVLDDLIEQSLMPPGTGDGPLQVLAAVERIHSHVRSVLVPDAATAPR